MKQKSPLLKGLENSRAVSFLINKASSVLSKLAPEWTYHKVKDQLLVPRKFTQQSTKVPRDMVQFTLETKEGNLQCYKQGRGATVVLVHGWSGSASQFFPLMRGLSQCGFRAVAFDHFAHGLSDCDQGSLRRFIAATEEVLKRLSKSNPGEPPAAIVGHAMGCLAIANAQPRLIKDIPLLMISPIFHFRKYFTRQVNLLGLPAHLSKKYLSQLEQSYLKDLDKMELDQKLKDYAQDTVIVHDKTDEESSYLDSVKFCAANPQARLQLIQGFGHNRIINSESLWQQLKSHLNYEDITAQRFQKCS